LSGSYWHACHAELFGELARAICGEEVAHFGRLGPLAGAFGLENSGLEAVQISLSTTDELA